MLSIEDNVDLFPFNTFHITANARYFVHIRAVEELIDLLSADVFKTNKRLILGGGSNLLLTQDFDGLVIKNDIKGIEIQSEDDEHIVLRVGAGETWHQLVMHCVQHNWGGIENLSLIPGTVGAAPMQNIGAYGVELKESVVAVEAVEIKTGSKRIFNRDECEFGYRESIFKHKVKDQFFITHLVLRLTKRNHQLNISYGAIRDVLEANKIESPTIQSVSEAVIAIRKSKLPDPAQIGNAGSFFKNPSVDLSIVDSLKKEYPALPTFPGENGLIKVPAGWLIEQCGWKGKTLGNIGVHKNQALVLVNYGGGKGEDIWNLATQIRKSVNKKFNIELQPEVNII
jgi:UDP-N-acetylmuramate dehydrogenase